MKQISMFFLVLFISGTWVLGQINVPLWRTLPVPPPMVKPDRSGFAPVNGINLYFSVFNEGGKDPVILLHGGFTSSDVWSYEVPLLLKTHEVIIVDSRGHGRSSLGNKPLGYNLMAADVLQLLEYLKIDKTSIIGWSDGGIIGMILAINNPERISKLFTFGSNYNLSGYKSEPVDPKLATLFMTRAETNYRKLSPTPDNFDQLKKSLKKLYQSEPDLKPELLKKIKAQTVIAYGQYDQFIKPEHFRELSLLIPKAKLIVIPNVGHGGPLQDPSTFHREVISLLDSHN